MRPPSRLPTLRLSVLAGVLACALGPSGSQAIGLQQEECMYMKRIEAERKQCLEQARLENETAGCSKMWDNLTCWPATPRGQAVVLTCPLIFKIFSPIEGRNVSRSCTDEGWTHLEPGPYPFACGMEDRPPGLDEQQQTVFYSSVKTGYTIGYSLSLAALLVATAILSLFRKLHCTRNYIHMNLFMSFILRAVAVFIKDLALFDSEESDQCEGSVGCKAAVVLFQYCVMANFFWLLVEGLYLYTLLAVSFFSERKYFWGYILIGWGMVPGRAAKLGIEGVRPGMLPGGRCQLRQVSMDEGCSGANEWDSQGVPSTFTMIWTIIRIYWENFGTISLLLPNPPLPRCWDTIGSPLWWIIKGPIVISILVNFILFICIIRILLQKLRPPEVGRSDSSPYSRLAKSTLLLIPLFGVHYIIFAFFPDNFKAEVKLVFELVLGSFQGFVVAILYCFLNGEVQAELRRKWRRWHLQGILCLDPKYHHPSGGSNGATCSTQVSMLTRVSPGARRSSSFQAEVSLV
ncbi:Vasoactive intestinal polypeptide receptor 1 [Galemys pyrenaicus]|uniref:Vasoactive intestinal polypeptide receptor 1 n=1 Tax=Galemys pyrenaicus TaxID=202257 RepID=A0A8J6AGZ8_GALPY|nr:Vasoactive intestinal polypeptide receptor 1 [Galemys pyrenaicus]